MNSRVLLVSLAALAISSGALGQVGSLREGSKIQISSTQITTTQIMWRSDVQNDIQLSTRQKERLDRIRADAAKQTRGGINPGTRNFNATQTGMANYANQLNQQFEEVLTAEQKNRLAQIRLQMLGNNVVLDPEIQKTLDISDDQKAQIETAQVQAQNQMLDVRDRLKSKQITAKQAPAEFMRVRSSYMTALGKVLTPEQSTKLKEIEGRPFVRQKSKSG